MTRYQRIVLNLIVAVALLLFVAALKALNNAVGRELHSHADEGTDNGRNRGGEE